MPIEIDYPSLYQVAEDNRQSYVSANPFPHIILQDLFADSILEEILARFPRPEDTDNWRRMHVKHPSGDMQVGKLGLADDHAIPPLIRNFVWELCSAPFLGFLEKLTGINNLIPDPAMRGGGLHQILPGGLLGVHADFTRHKVYDIDRRINLLIFLNKDWHDEYGGHLELWSRDVSHCVKSIRPLFGRCVIFNTDTDSYHGHPNPLTCPEDRTRSSIALYYYTNGRNDRDVTPTADTDWQALPVVEKPEHQ